MGCLVNFWFRVSFNSNAFDLNRNAFAIDSNTSSVKIFVRYIALNFTSFVQKRKSHFSKNPSSRFLSLKYFGLKFCLNVQAVFFYHLSQACILQTRVWNKINEYFKIMIQLMSISWIYSIWFLICKDLFCSID